MHPLGARIVLHIDPLPRILTSESFLVVHLVPMSRASLRSVALLNVKSTQKHTFQFAYFFTMLECGLLGSLVACLVNPPAVGRYTMPGAMPPRPPAPCVLHIWFANGVQPSHPPAPRLPQLMWLSGRLMLLVAEVRGSIPCETLRLE